MSMCLRVKCYSSAFGRIKRFLLISLFDSTMTPNQLIIFANFQSIYRTDSASLHCTVFKRNSFPTKILHIVASNFDKFNAICWHNLIVNHTEQRSHTTRALFSLCCFINFPLARPTLLTSREQGEKKMPWFVYLLKQRLLPLPPPHLSTWRNFLCPSDFVPLYFGRIFRHGNMSPRTGNRAVYRAKV